MKTIYYIYDNNGKFVGFADNEQFARQIAEGYGGKYEIGSIEEFKWNNN